MVEPISIIAGGIGALSSILLYLRLLAKRLDRIESKIDIMNGTQAKLLVRVAILEDRDEHHAA